MFNITEALLNFKIVQLEGQLAIYESLITEIEKLESMEKITSEIKFKLKDVVAVWDSKHGKKG